MNPGDMHQHDDEPTPDERDAMRITGFAVVYASGFLSGVLVTLWVML